MSSEPRYKHDVFISYGHLDNRPLPGQESGWVTVFHESLEVLLGEWRGADARIWRDNKIAGNDYITPTIMNVLPETAVIVSVVSRRYVNSEWCLREAQEFCRAAEANGGLTVEDRARIFKVVKLPIKNEERYFRSKTDFEFYQQAFRDLHGYEFYQTKDGRVQTFRLELEKNAVEQYWAKLTDLAKDLSDLLDALEERQETPDEEPAARAPEGVVYLAETTDDLQAERDGLRRDLVERNYLVLPDKPLPADAAEFERAVREGVARSRLSIHLVGAQYGSPLTAGGLAPVEWQNQIAAERDHDPNFSRLIWVPQKTKAAEFRQRVLISKLTRSNSAGITELLQEDSIEKFKTIIQDTLTAPKPKARRAARPPGLHLVYIVCDRRDLEPCEELRRLLIAAGYEVALPSFEGDEGAAREEQTSYLRMCQSVIVYWGGAQPLWLRSKLQDLQKIFGDGRTEPFAALAVYAGSPATREKENFLTNEALYIKSFGERVTPESLQPFLDSLDAEAEGERA